MYLRTLQYISRLFFWIRLRYVAPFLMAQDYKQIPWEAVNNATDWSCPTSVLQRVISVNGIATN